MALIESIDESEVIRRLGEDPATVRSLSVPETMSFDTSEAECVSGGRTGNISYTAEGIGHATAVPGVIRNLSRGGAVSALRFDVNDSFCDRAAQTLSEYRAGTTSLRRLIDTLDSVWSNLEPSEWRDELRGHWWTLEQIYSVALDRGGNLASLSREEMRDVEEAVNELEVLVG